MDFRTEVNIPAPGFAIPPFEDMLFVGSCFADNIGSRFIDYKFRADRKRTRQNNNHVEQSRFPC